MYTVYALIFAGFNVRGFHGSAAIHEFFVHEYLNVTVEGHAYSLSQSMTSCVTKMALTSTLGLLLTGYGPTLPQEERTDARDRARYMADRFSASLHCNSKRIFSVASFLGPTMPFSNERRPYLLVNVKSSDVALHSMTSSNESNNESSKLCTSAAAVYYYGIRTYCVHPRIFQHHCIQQPRI